MSGAAIIIFLSFFLYSDAGEGREEKKERKGGRCSLSLWQRRNAIARKARQGEREREREKRGNRELMGRGRQRASGVLRQYRAGPAARTVSDYYDECSQDSHISIFGARILRAERP